MHYSVLLVDDEKQSMRWYHKALTTSGFKVSQLVNPDQVRDFIDNPENRPPDVIILDIMLPPGAWYRNTPQAQRGLRTGVLLYEECLSKYTRTPIIVLTNVNKPDLAKALPADAHVFSKLDVPPFRLVDILRGLVPSYN